MENPKDWKQELKNVLDKTCNNRREDWLKIIHLCEDYNKEIQAHTNWIAGQSSFVETIRRQYVGLFVTRFEETPPERKPQLPLKEIVNEKVLKTREDKREAIKQAMLAITRPNMEFKANDVFEELIRRGIDLGVRKPQNVISTVLASLKSDVAKMSGKKGAFKRLTNQSIEGVIINDPK